MGWEWLNEIVPGNVDDPVAVYLRFCRVANAASKQVDPDYKNQLAGGLWPRTYRQELLKAGVAEHIDILPIHYGSGPAIEEARYDAHSVGADGLWITDNESGRGASTEVTSRSRKRRSHLPSRPRAGTTRRRATHFHPVLRIPQAASR